MKMIYIDVECKCHVTNDGTMTAVETDFFDGKCTEFIEGHRLVRENVNIEGEDGVESYTEMIAPWKPYDELDAAQRKYERALILDMQNALNKLGVTLDE